MGELAWRRSGFQVHKWIGLILAILIVPISLSGAALVWDGALDRLANPQRFVGDGAAALPVDRYADAARPVLKSGERIAQVTLPDKDGAPVVVAAVAEADRAARPQRTNVYLDPATARVLDVASSASGVARFLHVLHGSLQVPGVGRSIVGAVGVAMMVSSFTGLWLWWPVTGRWVRGFRWGRHRHTDANLHHLAGLWISLPLFMLSLTGTWISFPTFFVMLSGSELPHRADRGMMARPMARPAQPLAVVVARATAVTPGRVRSIIWPTERGPDWTVTMAADGPAAAVKIADDTGSASAAVARPAQGRAAGLMRRLHDGTGMGLAWQIVIFVGGVLPAVLAITGVIMWWRARGWKRALADKRGRGVTAVR